MGSNLGDAEANLNEALTRLDNYGNDLVFDAQSPVYRTEPIGLKDQPWFSNAVVRFKAASDIWAPEGLLSTLNAVEAQMGRMRDDLVPGGPRVIDLDLLLFGDTVMSTDYLTLPHPRLCARAFVLVPLLDIAPDLVLPDGRAAKDVLAGLKYSRSGQEILQK